MCKKFDHFKPLIIIMKVYIFNILRSKMCDNSSTKAKKGLVEHCSDQWGIFRYCFYFFSELYLFKLESMTACFHWFPKIPSWILPEVSLNESQALIPSAENRETWIFIVGWSHNVTGYPGSPAPPSFI